MEVLTQIAKDYGLFAALVVYVLWDGRQRDRASQLREQRYLNIIDKLSKSFDALKRDVGIIKDKLIERDGKND